jgi:hypothetical protein
MPLTIPKISISDIKMSLSRCSIHGVAESERAADGLAAGHGAFTPAIVAISLLFQPPLVTLRSEISSGDR